MRIQFSIVTPNLNRENMIGDALDSVAEQKGASFEHIVVDGGSCDNSVALAEASGARVISAPGSNIYEAVNIGLLQSHGEFICLLNSDDWLRSGALVAALAAFKDRPELDLVRGRATIEKRIGDRWVELPNISEPVAPSLRNTLLGRPNINACFFKQELVERVGFFDTRYAISADREWLSRVLLSGARTAGLNADIYVYRSHAGSLTIGRRRVATETWLREHLDFSRALLRDSHVAAKDRRVLRQFHAKETVHFVMRALRRFGITDLIGVTARSFRASPLWPLHAMAPIAAIAARRLIGTQVRASHITCKQ